MFVLGFLGFRLFDLISIYGIAGVGYGVFVLFLQVGGSGLLTSFVAPLVFLLLFGKLDFRGRHPRGRRPPPPRIRRPSVMRLLPRALWVSPAALVPRKMVAASALHAVTEGVGDRRAANFFPGVAARAQEDPKEPWGPQNDRK